MRCKNCGAHYRTLQLACPYCDTENLLGRIWQKQRSDAELEYERTSSAVNKVTNPFVLNRVLNRILLVEIVLAFLSVVMVAGYFLIKDYVRSHPGSARRNEIMTEINELYDKGDHYQMYTYMQENEVWDDEETFRYWQAGIMAYDFNNFRNYEMIFFDYDKEQKQKDTFYLEYSIEYGFRILRKNYGIYSELTKENEAVHEKHVSEVIAYFKGYLGLSEETISEYVSSDYIMNSEMESLIREVRERNDW